MSNRTRHESSFDATDERGEHHTLNVFVDIIDAGTMDDPHATIEGLRSIRTAAGDCVNRIAKGSYQIVTTGMNLTSSDPAAF